MIFNMYQTLTLWEAGGYDDYGQPVMSAPVHVRCRWQDVAKLFHAADGSEFISQAIVYPERKIKNGDFIALGENATLTDAKEVRFSGSSPSLTNDKELFKVAL